MVCRLHFRELLGRKQLFPGDDYIHQLQIISDVLGTPADEDLEFVTSDKARRFMKSQAFKQKVPFSKLYPVAPEGSANPLALDLLEKMLQFNPSKRIDVKAAMQHPYLESLHNPDDEPECKEEFDFSFEGATLTKELIQELIFAEMCHFHEDKRAELIKTCESRGRKVSSEGNVIITAQGASAGGGEGGAPLAVPQWRNSAKDKCNVTRRRSASRSSCMMCLVGDAIEGNYT